MVRSVGVQKRGEGLDEGRLDRVPSPPEAKAAEAQHPGQGKQLELRGEGSVKPPSLDVPQGEVSLDNED